MQRSIKKVFSLIFVLVTALFLLVACGQEVVDEGITQEKLEALVFEDATFAYDGETHSIYVENIYENEGVTITYIGNNVKLPGVYTVDAYIKYEELKVVKKAKITITKLASELTAKAEQIFYLSNNPVQLEYSLNNDKQEVAIINEEGKAVDSSYYSKFGTYNLELYAKENQYCSESNHVKVTVKVITSMFDISFDSQKYVEDGSEKTIELTGTLPSGYTVEYENNKGTESGKYYAYANIKDASGAVVETHRAVLTIEVPENEIFKQYLDEFFVEYLEGDQLSVNIFCENPADFGLEHYDAKWYTFESFTDEELASDVEYFTELLEQLQTFKDQELSDLQRVAYNNIESFLQYYVDYYAIPDVIFMELNYIDQFGGYIAEFGTYMEAYSIRTELELQDIVDYFESTKTAFPSYLVFAQEKLDKGFGYSDFTLKEMKKYLEDIIEQGEDYYLKDIINAKIDKVDFVDQAKKDEYKEKIANAIKDCFVPGVKELYEGLDQFIGKVTEDKEGYLTSYENGKELYLLDLEKLLGMENLDINTYIMQLDKTIDATIKDVISTQQKIIDYYNVTSYAQLEYVINSNPIFDGTPDEMMIYLKEFAKTIVPELKTDPNIVIKEMDEASAKVSNAVAYYMKSALDNTGSEYITLNPEKLSSSGKNDVIGTLAHEGYPGHLYAYVYSKELGLSNLSTIMTSTAHGEGWATYVELKLYEHAKEQSNDPKYGAIMDYLYANQLSGFLLETRLDVAIHYEGWKTAEIAKYMDDLGYNSSAAGEIYNLLIETPTSYAAYGYGKLTFYSLHQNAKNILGTFYDEVEFNTMLLSKGWTSLGELNATYEAYMKDKCFECGIEYK